MIMKTMLEIVEAVADKLPPKTDDERLVYSFAKLLAAIYDEQNKEIVEIEPSFLDASMKIQGIARKTSPERTEECPMFDILTGVYCESDDQLRARLKASLNGGSDGTRTS